MFESQQRSHLRLSRIINSCNKIETRICLRNFVLVILSFRAYFNPLNFAFTGPDKGKFRISDYVDNSRNLGGKIELPKFADDPDKSIGDVPTRMMTESIVDLGTVEVGVSTEKNADALEFQSQSPLRDIIPTISTLFKTFLPLLVILIWKQVMSLSAYLLQQRQRKRSMIRSKSGLYMIKELCHHFDSKGSYTSAKIIS